MSSLTIAAREATGETGKIAWSAELTDADGVPVAGHITSGANTGQIVQPSRGYTDTDGDVTLDLEANANITPANTYWTVFVGPRSFLVSKGSGTETLTAALASDPGTLGTTALAAHIADTVDAHDASAISFSPTGSIAGTDVQTAVAEVATDAASALTAHTGDSSAAHAASAVSFTPAGSVAATDVQTAVAEVDSEKLAIASNLSDVASAAAARTNLGLGTMAVEAAGDYVAKTVVDAKGDLIVGTAADTVARLAVGSDGAVPVANANSAEGILWASPMVTSLFASGQYTGPAGTYSTSGEVVDRVYYTPIFVPRRTTFDRIAVDHTSTAAGAGGVQRLGIYSTASGDKPGTLILDAGTVDMTTAPALKAITISQTLNPGLYWLATVGQVAGSPALRALTSGVVQAPGAATTQSTGFTQNSVSGALPSTAAPVQAATTILAFLRAA